MPTYTPNMNLVKYSQDDKVSPVGYNPTSMRSTRRSPNSQTTTSSRAASTAHGDTRSGRAGTSICTPRSLGDESDNHFSTGQHGEFDLPPSLLKAKDAEVVSCVSLPFFSDTGYVLQFGQGFGGIMPGDTAKTGTWRYASWNGRPDATITAKICIQIKGRWK